MNSLKCSNCGLTNFPDVFDCRRCGESLFSTRQEKKRISTPRWLSVWSLLVIAGAVGIVYYFYHGVQVSMQEMEREEQQRIAAQPKPRSNNLSRSEAEKQRAGSYGSAVSNSQSLKDHQKHIDETQKIMNQVSNSK
jgi:uncharacterized protein HemX